MLDGLKNKMNTLYRKIFNELSGDTAKHISSKICKHYQSFGSVGYHAATDYVLDEIKKTKNIGVRVTNYPLDGETEKLKQKMTKRICRIHSLKLNY